MPDNIIQKRIVILAILIIVVLTIGRLAKTHFDSSYFIVAGSDFVDSSKTVAPITIQKGQGYDGQFYYRYALNPFNFSKDSYGINVDVVPYRIQRIAYPFFAWLLSFGGKPYLVPWMLILVNILAFIGIVIYTNKFILFTNSNPALGYLPLLLPGIYMSFSRDLSEVLELFFFVGAIYYLYKTKFLLFSVFAMFTILARDTSVIALFPLSCGVAYRVIKNNFKSISLVYLIFPFLVFALWKIYILLNISSPDITEGYQKMGLPFLGIIDGWRYNFNFSDTKNTLQFIFWVAYLCWNTYLAVVVFRIISFKSLFDFNNQNILSIIYCIWFLFAICITLTIYIDDWGFVRIFSLWNMIGFLIIIINKKPTGKLFNWGSLVLVILTIIRLIIRV